MSGVNQFRQLFVVKQVDDNDTYILDKFIKDATTWAAEKAAKTLYVDVAGTMTAMSSAYYVATDVTSSNFSTKKSSLYTESGGTYSSAASATYDSSETYYYGYNDAYVPKTKYYVKDVSKNGSNDGAIVNEVGEIEVNTDKEGNIYFSYGGQSGNPLRSDLIEPDQIVSAKASAPTQFNKQKLINKAKFSVNATFFSGMSADESKKVAGVPMTINFTNFGNGVNSIYPFSIFIKNNGATGIDAQYVADAFNSVDVVDLAGAKIAEATVESGDVVITAVKSGKYVPGKTDVYYPQFTISVPQEYDTIISSDIEYSSSVDPDAGLNDSDIASEMELIYAGSRFNGGQTLPFNFPFNGNFEQQVVKGHSYSCIDIHYYKTNAPDFSQKSHGTITLLCDETQYSTDNSGNATGCGLANDIVSKLRSAYNPKSASVTLDCLTSTAANFKEVIDIF
jgi:hypothetical protein